MASKLDLAGLRAQFTPPVAYGLVLIVFVIGFTVIAGVGDATEGARERRDTALAELAVLETLEAQSVWEARLTEAQDLAADLDVATWSAPTLGAASAQIESRLRVIHAESRPQGRRVSASDAALLVTTEPVGDVGPNGVTDVEFQVTGKLDPNEIDAFLHALAIQSPALTVDSLQMNLPDNLNPVNFGLNGRARVRIGEGAAS